MRVRSRWSGDSAGRARDPEGSGASKLRGGARGDLHVVLRVVVPQDLDAEQIELAAALEGTIDEANLNVDGGKAGAHVCAGVAARGTGLRNQGDSPAFAAAPISRSRCSPSSSSCTGRVEEERGETYVEYAIYGPPGELPAVPALEAAAGEGLVEISSSEIPDDWADRWRDFHEPIRVGRLCVRPTWLEPDPQAEIDVAVDPGQAFGTGAHATTKMCLKLLLGLDEAGEASGPLSDLGTGLGVLAIAAAKLGFGPVTGFDHEKPAVEAAIHNAHANDVGVEVHRANLREGLPELAPTVVANLTSPLLESIAERIPHPPPVAVLSGLLVSEADQVAAAFAASGMSEARRLADGDWAALLLRREEAGG